MEGEANGLLVRREEIVCSIGSPRVPRGSISSASSAFRFHFSNSLLLSPPPSLPVPWCPNASRLLYPYRSSRHVAIGSLSSRDPRPQGVANRFGCLDAARPHHAFSWSSRQTPMIRRKIPFDFDVHYILLGSSTEASAEHCLDAQSWQRIFLRCPAPRLRAWKRSPKLLKIMNTTPRCPSDIGCGPPQRWSERQVLLPRQRPPMHHAD